MAVVRYSLTLDPVGDADVIRWLELQPKTTEAVRAALRAYLRRPGHAEIEIKLDEILDVLRRVKVIAADDAPQDGSQGEPARAARGLDAMLSRFSRK